ncbi:MAG: diaminopimelate decarboxylase [Oscillospiraceae bacterium]|nr:diaminopimelate decarboxylase [Oscillospiraceae bacterium]
MKKTPFLTLEKAKEIREQIPTPFHVYDEAGIRANARALKAAFSWNPGFKEFFAVKATPNPFLLKILHEEGCGCDCATYTELLLSEAVGITGHDVVFSSNVTPELDMRKARDMGVYINLDDATYVDFLASMGPVPETVCLRYNPGGSFSLGNTIMDMPRDAKYGMTEDQMAGAITRLMKLGTKHFGVHAFLASNTTTNEYYPALAGQLFRLAVRLRNATGAHISFIDLSGGIGVDYRPEQPRCDIGVIGEGVRVKYEEILTPNDMGDVAIFTGLGRFMLAPYGHLISTVIHEKHIYREYVGLDACAANLMRPAMYGAYHHITVLGKEDAILDHVYDVTGGLCENNDKFAIERSLPEIQIGDIVAIHDTGAHGFSMGYNYNGKLRSAEVLLKEDGSFQLIRRAETPEDYFATFDFSDFHFGK